MNFRHKYYYSNDGVLFGPLYNKTQIKASILRNLEPESLCRRIERRTGNSTIYSFPKSPPIQKLIKK